ncbi:hypothetical protein PG994_007943 [Apiospora phragmitis]|uniref:Ankyrin repeat domain-containing protein n=1 Tax=Apiospora phragmitis TaxID=2905665 RepID=A0ABR1URM0_9PEZI
MPNSAKATLSKADQAGNTALHEAAVGGSTIAQLEELLQAGVDVNQPNSAGRLPLHTVCSVGYYDPELPTYLSEQGKWIMERTKDVDACDKNTIRPLHLASMMSEYLVQGLLAAGADPAGATSEGLTPLHLAARARQSNITGILLEALAKAGIISQHVDARDDLGRAPLHYACRSGRSETVGLLLAAGAAPTAQDEQGMTPLEACTEFEEE